MKYLNELQVGEQAEITTVNADLGASQRMLAMGLLPGTAVEVTGVAPFGDPLTVKINNRPVSLRRAEAALVEVKI